MMQTTINNCFQRTATTWIKACLVVIGVIACSLQYTAVIGWCPLLVRQQGQHGLRHVRQVSSARRQAALATPTTSTQDDDIGSSAALAADVQMTSVVMNHTKTLINYATGISAARRRRSSSRWLQFDTDQNDSNHYKTRKKKQSQQYQAKQDQAMGACRSLLQFLNNKDISIDSQSMTEFNNTRTSVASPSQYYILPHIDEALARACVQALRAAGEANDYIYITNLIDTVVAYCCGYYNTAFLPSGNSNTTSPIIVLLHSRIFGEAITAMMITDAGPSKIKRIWQRLLEVSNYNHQYKNNNNTTTTNLKLQQQHQQQSHSNLSIINTNILASQPSAMEMNYMIRALSSRKKYHAALHLYYNHDFIIPDSFTVTSCLKMLIDSIIVSSSNIEKSTEESASSATSIAKTAMQVVIKKKKKVTTKEHEESSDEGFWQWEEAKKVIEYARTKQQQKNTQQQQQQQQQQNELLINSHVYGALLTLNEKLATRRRDMIHNHDVISKNTHDEAANALDILQQMQKDNVSPDVVVCTKVMAALGRCNRGREAVTLLNLMRKTYHEQLLQQSKSIVHCGVIATPNWTLPPPNEYTYSTAISACAKYYNSDHDSTIIGIVDTMTNDARNGSIAPAVKPNTIVYNAAISALLTSTRDNKKDIVLSIFKRMEKDAREEGWNTAPDTITYNLVLAALGHKSGYEQKGEDKCHDLEKDHSLWSSSFIANKQTIPRDTDTSGNMPGNTAEKLLKKMETDGVTRDVGTYCNALRALRFDNVSTIKGVLSSGLRDLCSNTRGGRPTEAELLQVCNTVLSVSIDSCSISLALHVVQEMVDRQIYADSMSWLHLITVLGMDNINRDSPLLTLDALRGEVDARIALFNSYGIDVAASCRQWPPVLHERFYTDVISTCVKAEVPDVKFAILVLGRMKLDGIEPTSWTYQSLIVACCASATKFASQDYKQSLQQRENTSDINLCQRAKRRAKLALILMRSMKEEAVSTPSLQSSVIRACAVSGMWEEALRMLHSLQERALGENNSLDMASNTCAYVLPHLHRSLLSIAARYGNIESALHVADSVHALSRNLSGSKECYVNNNLPLKSSIRFGSNDEFGEISCNSSFNRIVRKTFKPSQVGMGAEEWSLIMIAASKNRNWRICLRSLQSLRPFVEATNVAFAESIPDGHLKIAEKNRNYSRLSRTLTSAILCFEACDRYAWAMRAVDDWIEWSGRQPPKQAVIAAFRSLSAMGHGSQALNLVAKILSRDLDLSDFADVSTKEEYARDICIQGITALYKNGDYNTADEMYSVAIQGGHIRWPIILEGKNEAGTEGSFVFAKNCFMPPVTLDLHNMTGPIAHSAVRMALQHVEAVSEKSRGFERGQKSIEIWGRDIVIITGRGKHSSERLKPILRPEVQRMLAEEFYPPLSSMTVPGNMGAVRIPTSDVGRWLTFNREQKGIRMLLVADMMRSVSSPDRILEAIQNVAAQSIS